MCIEQWKASSFSARVRKCDSDFVVTARPRKFFKQIVLHTNQRKMEKKRKIELFIASVDWSNLNHWNAGIQSQRTDNWLLLNRNDNSSSNHTTTFCHFVHFLCFENVSVFVVCTLSILWWLFFIKCRVIDVTDCDKVGEYFCAVRATNTPELQHMLVLNWIVNYGKMLIGHLSVTSIRIWYQARANENTFICN